MYGKLSIFTGNASPAFASAVCEHIGVPLGRAEVFEFSNENIFVKIQDVVREQDVFVVQSLCSPVTKSIFELLIMIDALKRASASRITAVVPYYAYGRTDKKDQPRVPITGRLLADLLTVAGAQRVLSIDLHAGQIAGFFNIPFDELSAMPLLCNYFIDNGLAEDAVVVAPDLGGAKKARNFAERLNVPVAMIEKRRIGNESRSEILNIIGDINRPRAILVDDEIDTAGSIVQAANTVARAGVKEIYAVCTHPVLSGPAISRLKEANFKGIVTTDTIPIPPEKRLDNMVVLSVAKMFAQTIQRIHEGGSVGALFEQY
jgi:ribose-phosphate pyrophosphokinase